MARSSRPGGRPSRGLSKWQRAAGQDRPLFVGGPAGDTTENHADGAWVVRRISGATSSKDYTCPGCFGRIRPATPHVVAWPESRPLLGGEASDARRHWHTACWERRGRTGR